jgi:integrase
MSSLKLILDTRRIKKDKTFPLVFRISIKTAYRDISTGFSCKESDWNQRTNSLKETHPNSAVIAPRIKELELEYLAKLIEFEKLNPGIADVQRIKEYLISTPKQTHTVSSFWLEEIKDLKKAGKYGGARVSNESYLAISRVKSLNIAFEAVDYNFLKQIETEFLSSGKGVNTISVYLRALRAIYNKAINSKLTDFKHYPFRTFKIKKAKTLPRTLNIEELRRIFHLQVNKTSYLYESLLIGKLIFLLIGINYKDLMTLTGENIKGDRLIYRRSKTKRLYSIKLLPEAVDIFTYFSEKKKANLLGTFSQKEFEDKQKLSETIRWKNKNFNVHLEHLGLMAGCKEKLTSYVFRYTWANIAKQLGYSKDLIAEALGHEYGNKVTGIYLEAFDKELIDEMNEKVIYTIIYSVIDT